jgi:lycopene beta-cyclase
MTRVLIAGGGLAGGLLALRLAAKRRDVDVTILERATALGGTHTWSFHTSDLDGDTIALVGPLVERTWAGYAVRFPAHRRRVALQYASLRSERLDAAVHKALPHGVLTRAEVVALGESGARLADGSWIAADCVVDARGPRTGPAQGAWGCQAFFGLDLELARPHGLAEPVLMDATIEQSGGFRFVYALPWGTQRILVEDTCYGGPELDREASRARVLEWARREGWIVNGVAREEEGVLPIPLTARLDDAWHEGPAAPIGVRAGFFHATTGYSLPWAARLAVSIAALPRLDTASVAAHVRARAEREWESQGFFRLLNRLLFEAADEAARYRVLERFYRLPDALVARFYAGRLGWRDRMRLLSGRPPVALLRAFRAAVNMRAPEMGA